MRFMVICRDVHELNPEASVPYHCSHRIYIIGKCVCVCRCVCLCGGVFLNHYSRLECHFPSMADTCPVRQWGEKKKKAATCLWLKHGDKMRGMGRLRNRRAVGGEVERNFTLEYKKKMLVTKRDKRVRIHTHTHTHTQQCTHTFTKRAHKRYLVRVFILSLPDSSAL